jgi:hypothetical protein
VVITVIVHQLPRPGQTFAPDAFADVVGTQIPLPRDGVRQLPFPVDDIIYATLTQAVVAEDGSVADLTFEVAV